MNNISGYEEQENELHKIISNGLDELPPVFSEYCNHLLDSGKTETSVQVYLNTLLVCLKEIYSDNKTWDSSFFKQMDISNIKQYFALKENLSASTLQNRWTSLNSFFLFLNQRGVINFNPMQSIQRPVNSNAVRNLSYLTREELNSLFSTIKYSEPRWNALRDESVIKLGLSTGLPITSLLNLNVDDVDFDKGNILVRNKKSSRVVPIGEPMQLLLKEWMIYRKQYLGEKSINALFISQLKKRLSVDAVNRLIEKHCDEANIGRITFKDLKSTMIHLLAKNGVSMESIMGFLDIKDYMNVVQAYDAAMKEKETDIMPSIDALFCDKSICNNIISSSNHKFSINVKPPEYNTYAGGENGFTVFLNIINNTQSPINLKITSCELFMGGTLRASDYTLTGYTFKVGYILPDTIRTIAPIWITDSLNVNHMKSGQYIVIQIEEVENRIEHYIKYVFRKTNTYEWWEEADWYTMNVEEQIE